MQSNIAINGFPSDHFNFNKKVYQQTAQRTPLKFRDQGIVDNYVKKPKPYIQNIPINIQQKHFVEQAPNIMKQEQPFVEKTYTELKPPVVQAKKQQKSSWWQKLWGNCYSTDNSQSMFANCCGKKQTNNVLKNQHQQVVQAIPHQLAHQGQEVVYAQQRVIKPIQTVKQQPKKQSKKSFFKCCTQDINVRNYKIPIKDLTNVHFANCSCEVCLNYKMANSQPHLPPNQKQGQIVTYRQQNVVTYTNTNAQPHTDIPLHLQNNQISQVRNAGMPQNNLYNSVESVQHHF